MDHTSLMSGVELRKMTSVMGFNVRMHARLARVINYPADTGFRRKVVSFSRRCASVGLLPSVNREINRTLSVSRLR